MTFDAQTRVLGWRYKEQNNIENIKLTKPLPSRISHIACSYVTTLIYIKLRW